MLALPCCLGGGGRTTGGGAGGASAEGLGSPLAMSTDIARGAGKNMAGTLGAVPKGGRLVP